MENYSFLTIAPCAFRVEGQVFTLSAGQTFSVTPSIGQKLISPSFVYRNFITLISKPTESPTPANTIPEVVKPKEEKKVETQVQGTKPPENLVINNIVPTDEGVKVTTKIEPKNTEIVKVETPVDLETKKTRSTKKQS